MPRPHKIYPHPKTGAENTAEGWANLLGIKKATFQRRISKMGTGNPKAFLPDQGKHRGPPPKIFVKNPKTGKMMTVREIAKLTGNDERMTRSRVLNGADPFHAGKLINSYRFKGEKKYPYPERYIGYSLGEIAAVENVSSSTVSVWARTGNWPERLLPLASPGIR